MERKGTDLHPEDRRYVLSAYVHRFTAEHRPAWVNEARPCGNPYPVQFASDQDWLAHTTFRVRVDGRLDRRVKACSSSPTWPKSR